MSPSSSTTSTTQRLLQRSSRMNAATYIRSLRTPATRNSTMRPSGKRYLHHCSFRSEKNQRTVDELRLKNGNQVATWKTKESGFSLKDKKSKFSLKSGLRSRSTISSRSDRRSIQELSGVIDSQRREIDHALAGDEQSRRDQLLVQEQLSEQNRDLREAHMKSLYEMDELKRVQELRIDEFSKRR